eukprot:2174469-Rhodomonas_salina.2
MGILLYGSHLKQSRESASHTTGPYQSRFGQTHDEMLWPGPGRSEAARLVRLGHVVHTSSSSKDSCQIVVRAPGAARIVHKSAAGAPFQGRCAVVPSVTGRARNRWIIVRVTQVRRAGESGASHASATTRSVPVRSALAIFHSSVAALLGPVILRTLLAFRVFDGEIAVVVVPALAAAPVPVLALDRIRVGRAFLTARFCHVPICSALAVRGLEVAADRRARIRRARVAHPIPAVPLRLAQTVGDV